jgi:cholesterol oxidase
MSSRSIEVVEFPFECDGIPLELRQFKQLGPRDEVTPVLLLHGASARHETFTVPGNCPAGRPRSLAGVLYADGFEPWLLDWRGSGRVTDKLSDQQLADLRLKFDFDGAAREDLPEALRIIRSECPGGAVAAVAHCMGAGILAQAIAAGHVEGLSDVVLLTLGLFYEPPLDSRLKTQDHLLERHLDPGQHVLGVDPRKGSSWPPQLEALYENWPDSLRPHPRGNLSEVEELCDRLSFMYGTPYYEHNLVPEIHGLDGHTTAELPKQFGQIPLRMYAHGARNTRRGWAAAYDAGPGAEDALVDDESLKRFRKLRSVTLLTGQKNQLWHRDSIDRMYEWLSRGKRKPGPRLAKWVLPGHGHQDLLWGIRSRDEVFPTILSALRPPPNPDAHEGLELAGAEELVLPDTPLPDEPVQREGDDPVLRSKKP